MKFPGWHKFENSYLCKNGEIIISSILLRKIVNPITGEDELEGFLEDITERKKAESNLVESYKYLGTINRQVSVLLELSNVFNKKNKKGIMDFIVWSALEISNSKVAALYRYQKNGKENFFHLISMASAIDIKEKEKNGISFIPIKPAECVAEIKEEKTEKIEKCLKSTKLEEFRIGHDINSFCVLPMVDKGELAGVLILGIPPKRELTEHEKGFYNVFAKYATFILLDLGKLDSKHH